MSEAQKTRIGLLGGTFNPVHHGHLILAQTAMEVCELERVMLVPAASPPHKPTSNLISSQHRLAMLRMAVEGDPALEVSEIELRRGGVSYAVDTVAALCRERPHADIYFIIGADTLPELHLWKDIYDLLAMCTFVTFARPGARMDEILQRGLCLDHPWEARLLEHVTGSREIDISSSDIRHRIAEGLRIRYLVPDRVAMYIHEHNLYVS